MRALALVALAACGGETGTIQLELTTAPGSTLLAEVQHLRVTITDPRLVVEADRGDSGFDLVLDVEAVGSNASIVVEGLDAAGALIATGTSPPFPVAAISAKIIVYVAPPMSVLASPSRLPALRVGVGSTQLTYGIAIAGGSSEAVTEVTDNVFIYNAYDHSLLAGAPLPAPRTFAALATGSNDAVYIIGGTGPDQLATGTVFRFDTTTPPSGTYSTTADRPELARTTERALPLALERHIISGMPALEMTFGMIEPIVEVPLLPPNGATVTTSAGTFAIFGGAPLMRFVDDAFDALAESVDVRASATALPNGFVAFASPGETRDLLVIDAETGEASRRVDALSVVRSGAAIAATARHVVVAGGSDAGVAQPTCDILDATTLALIVTVPCVPRIDATATALPNGQIVIVGGSPANDAIELFTPDPPL